MNETCLTTFACDGSLVIEAPYHPAKAMRTGTVIAIIEFSPEYPHDHKPRVKVRWDQSDRYRASVLWSDRLSVLEDPSGDE